ncbi:hypothetical protein BBJ29_001705 [Phytophthora kernoviae]|uniref:Uncharacterized protein n=1 Tax=Phytophthora kernoviae TaxID=325452 RepID=A0A3F2S2X2_9STRA|nr:hypothetical protein BBJ29_001705 [Phytophthora kernoviae]RLN68720.1 hypothetical protein BBP00_00000824 [Phytophthora kernoviae]
MTGHAIRGSRVRGSDEVFPLQTLAKEPPTSRLSCAETLDPQLPYQHAAYMSYSVRPDGKNNRKITAMYGTIPTTVDARSNKKNTATATATPRPTESDSLLGGLKKQVSVEFALDIDSDDESNSLKSLESSCASRCMPRRLTIEEKAALYQVRPDLELVPTIFLMSELEEMRRQRQRKLMFSILGASLIMLMMLMFYYLVSQM